MIILGLGSNVGNRIANLRAALALIKAHAAIHVEQVAPLYVSDALLPEECGDVDVGVGVGVGVGAGAGAGAGVDVDVDVDVDVNASWQQPFINTALRCTSNLTPLDLLHALKKNGSTIGSRIACTALESAPNRY